MQINILCRAVVNVFYKHKCGYLEIRKSTTQRKVACLKPTSTAKAFSNVFLYKEEEEMSWSSKENSADSLG